MAVLVSEVSKALMILVFFANKSILDFLGMLLPHIPLYIAYLLVLLWYVAGGCSGLKLTILMYVRKVGIPGGC